MKLYDVNTATDAPIELNHTNGESFLSTVAR